MATRTAPRPKRTTGRVLIEQFAVGAASGPKLEIDEANGVIKRVRVLGRFSRNSHGLTEAEIANVGLIICLDILPNTATKHATAILPGAGFAEKRGSMVNVKGRIQRLNRATQPPGQARDDFEILSDLLRALGAEAPQTLEGVFKEMSAAIPAFNGLTLAKLGDGGIPLETMTR